MNSSVSIVKTPPTATGFIRDYSRLYLLRQEACLQEQEKQSTIAFSTVSGEIGIGGE